MKIEEAISALEAELEIIWINQPTADMKGLSAEYRPPSSDLPQRIYANFDLYWIAGMYYFFYQQLKKSEANCGVVADLLETFSQQSAKRFGTWGLKRANELIGNTAEVYGSCAQQPKQLLRLTKAVIIYLNRMQSWVDGTIPWAAMENLSALTAEGEKHA